MEIKKPQRFAVVKTQIVAPRVGFEPTTLGLEVLCSIQLSYQGVFTLYHLSATIVKACGCSTAVSMQVFQT